MNLTINGFEIKELDLLVKQQGVDWISTELTERKGDTEKDTLEFTFEEVVKDKVVRLVALYTMGIVLDQILTDEHSDLLEKRFESEANILVINGILQSYVKSDHSNLFPLAYKAVQSYFENNEMMDFEAFTFFNMQRHFDEYKYAADEVITQAVVFVEDIEAVHEIVECTQTFLEDNGRKNQYDKLSVSVVNPQDNIDSVKVLLEMSNGDDTEKVEVDLEWIKSVFIYNLPLQMIDVANGAGELRNFFSQVAHIPSLLVTFGIKHIQMDSYLFQLPFFHTYIGTIVAELKHFQFESHITLSV